MLFWLPFAASVMNADKYLDLGCASLVVPGCFDLVLLVFCLFVYFFVFVIVVLVSLNTQRIRTLFWCSTNMYNIFTFVLFIYHTAYRPVRCLYLLHQAVGQFQPAVEGLYRHQVEDHWIQSTIMQIPMIIHWLGIWVLAHRFMNLTYFQPKPKQLKG